MRTTTKALFILLFTLVSCNKKTDEEQKVKPFMLDGTAYETLQQAVKAASGYDAEIKLIMDASGEGAYIDKDCARNITINLQSFNYDVQDGCSLSIEDNNILLKGEGGCLYSSIGPVLKIGKYSSAVISGDLSISSTEAIYAEGAEISTEDFDGSIKGNIRLMESQFYLCDPACSIRSDVLEVKGEGAGFNAETDAESQSCCATFKTVVSDCKYPVTSIKEGCIKVQDGDVHIHNMTAKKIAATCMRRGRTVMTCQNCGYETVTFLKGEGKCEAKNLVYHPAKEASDTLFGNVEYWECPDCGKQYADSKAENELEDGALILPKSLIEGYDLINTLNGEMDLMIEGSNDVDPVSVVLSVVGILETFAMSLPGLISSDELKWQSVNMKLDKIQEGIQQLNRKMDRLFDEVGNIPHKLQISKRNSRISAMLIETFRTDSTIRAYHADSLKLSKKQIAMKKDTLIKYWAEQMKYENIPYVELTKDLVKDYYSRPLGLNIPEMWGEVGNSICVWEHEGYKLRCMQALCDASFLVSAAQMMGWYYARLKPYASQDLRKNDVNNRKDEILLYTSAVKNEMNRIKKRNSLYRRLNHYGKTFEKDSPKEWYFFHRWFEKNRDRRFPRDNQGNVAVQSCEKILEDYNLKDRDFITAEQAKFIYDVHNKRTKSKEKIRLYSILLDSLSFWCAAGYKANGIILFANDNSGFTHFDDDIALVRYKMFRWECYRSRRRDDRFGIYTTLKDDATKTYDLNLDDCSISSYDGEIYNLGSLCDWRWQTILVAKDEIK